MKLYNAGMYSSGLGRSEETSKHFRRLCENLRQMRLETRHHLESYHYIQKGRAVEKIRADRQRIFLDSGAFSAFSLGVEVDIVAYADFVKDNKDVIEMASVLDAIGDPEGTYHNQQELERLGVAVLPCFHYGEPWDLAEYYVRNYEYITIGGMVPISTPALREWLDELWDKVLTDRGGYSRTKVHGFGLTSWELMRRYPWFTVDSSSWVQIAATGGIVFPDYPQPVAISSKASQRKKFAGHYQTLPAVSREKVDKWFDYYGLSPEQLSEDYLARWVFNAYSFYMRGEALGADHWRKPFTVAQPGLF